MRRLSLLYIILVSVTLMQCISTSPIHKEAPSSIDINHYVSYEINERIIEFRAYSDDITDSESLRKAKIAADKLRIERGFSDSDISDPTFWVRFDGDLENINFNRRLFSHNKIRMNSTLALRVTLPDNVITENPLEHVYYKNNLRDTRINIKPSVLKVRYYRKSVLRKRPYTDAFWYLKKPEELYRLGREIQRPRWGERNPENKIDIDYWEIGPLLRNIYFTTLDFEVRDYESAMPIQNAEVIINGYYINDEKATVSDILKLMIVDSPYSYTYKSYINTQNINNLYRNNARTNSRGLLVSSHI